MATRKKSDTDTDQVVKEVRAAMMSDSELVNGLVDLAHKPQRADRFVTSRGAVLKLSPVSNMILNELTRQRPEPKVPRVFIDEKGREEENPNDPDYLAAVRDHNYDLGMLSIDISLALGTELDVEEPQGIGMIWPQEEEWRAGLVFIGLQPATEGPARYVDWVKYYATTSVAELQALHEAVRSLSGYVTESAVQAVEDSFRSDEERDTNTSVYVTPEVSLGDTGSNNGVES